MNVVVDRRTFSVLMLVAVLSVAMGYASIAWTPEVTLIIVATVGMMVFIGSVGVRPFLMIVAAVLPYSEYLPNHFALPLTLLLLIFALTSQRRKVPWTLAPYMTLIAWMLLRYIFSATNLVEGASALGSPLRLILPVCFALACFAHFRGGRDLIRMASIAITIPLFVTVAELAQSHLHFSQRLDGGVVRPATLGMFAAFLVAATWPIAAAYRGRAWYPVIAGTICVLLSGSRGALIAIVLSVVLPGLFARASASRQRTRRLLTIFAVAGPLALVAFGGETISRLTEAVSQGPTQYEQHITDTPIGARAVIWKIEVDFYKRSSPLLKLVGNGTGASEKAIMIYFHGGLADPHDEFLHFLVDYGWIGVALFVFLLLGGLTSMRKLGASPLALVPASVTIVLLTLGLTDNPTFFALALAIPLAAVALAGRSATDEGETTTDAAQLTSASQRPTPVMFG